MKELISAVLDAEENLQKKAKSVDEKIQDLNIQAEGKISRMNKELEDEITGEKNEKTNSLDIEIRVYSDKLHNEIERDMKAKREKLNAKKPAIFSGIINSIIG